MCPYGILYNMLHMLPWPALVAQLTPYLEALKARRPKAKVKSKAKV
jgi:hypothetical protein